MKTKTHTRSARIAWSTLVMGISSSLAMNLQAINLGTDSPGIGAYVSAVFWPIALFAAIELMLHTPWISSKRDALTKWAGLLGVTGMAAWISYWHGVHVLTAFGYDTASAHFGPIAVDMLMAMATLALNRVGQARLSALVTVQDIPAPATKPSDWKASDTDSTWLARIGADLDSTTTPAFSLTELTAGGQAATNRITPNNIPAEARELLTAWNPRAVPAGHVDTLLASHFTISPRTARGWRAAVRPAVRASK